MEQGKIKVNPLETEGPVTFHDPCYLGRYNDHYDGPRALVEQSTGKEITEAERSRENSMCCGAGGARMWMEETIGRRINVVRVEQALPQRPRVIATACPYCLTMMEDGVKTRGRETDIVTRDVAELVAAAISPP